MSPEKEPSSAEFDEMFRESYASVLAYVRRRAPAARVDDAVAETFLVAWRRRERNPAEPLPWLFGIARRVLSTQARSDRRQARLRIRLARQRAVAVADPAESGTVTAALWELGAKDREALMLTAWEGLSPSQAACAGRRPAAALRPRPARDLHGRAAFALRGDPDRVR